MPTLIPVDHDPFDMAGTLAWQRGVDMALGFDRPTPEVQGQDRAGDLMRAMGQAGGTLGNIGSGIAHEAANVVKTPGAMMAPNPYPAGSEEADYYDASKRNIGSDWAGGMALNMMGTGSFAGSPGSIGTAGGKLIQPEGIRAYHGSPHDFERFDISKIGTGEGAQSYGHGLYFAENPATAKAYRERLSANAPYLRGDQQILHPELYGAMESAARATGIHPDQSGQITSQILKLIEKEGNSAKVYGSYEPPKGFERAWDAALDVARDIKWNTNPGKMYEVNINARPEQFLDWDKPLSSHSPDIQEALFRAGGTNPNSLAYGELKSRYLSPLNDAMRGTEMGRFLTAEDVLNGNVNMSAVAKSLEGDPARLARIQTIVDAHKNDPALFANQDLSVPGRSAYMKMTNSGPSGSTAYGVMDSKYEPRASATLLEHGIPGIKYLDQGSRNPGFSSLTPVQLDTRIESLRGDIAGGGGNQQRMAEQLALLEHERDTYRKQTSNYVLFDDKLINILRKYGIAGLSMLPPAVAASVQSRLIPVDHDPFAQ